MRFIRGNGWRSGNTGGRIKAGFGGCLYCVPWRSGGCMGYFCIEGLRIYRAP